MPKYTVRFDETYRLNGEYGKFEFTVKEEAIDAYNNQRRGFASIIVEEDNELKILQDNLGRKYVKGSPFYRFPHVPHISILDGKEIEST